MTPTFHPRLVNGRFGDPALFVEMLLRREALLFDMGDLSALSTRDLLRVSHVFVSHMHMDHFIGFDALLRAHIGREKTLRIVGPEGLCERIHHKLQGYEWDLVERYDADFAVEASDVREDGQRRAACFRFKNRFAWEPPTSDAGRRGGFEVQAALLEHHGPCLGFALTEPAHVNIWKVRLDERGLVTGPWLQELKAAVLRGESDQRPIETPQGVAQLGELRNLLTISPGQKVAYVTDVADTSENRATITDLAEGADLFFLEARFAADDAHHAQARAHLTTKAAGEIGRAAGARRLEPFHFSARYEDQEKRLMEEVEFAFGYHCADQ